MIYLFQISYKLIINIQRKNTIPFSFLCDPAVILATGLYNYLFY